MSTATESTEKDQVSEAAEEAIGNLPFNTAEETREFLEKFGGNARTFQDFTQLTPTSMEAIYMVGYNQFNAGRYDEAEKIFRLLAMLNHYERKYWRALGAARQLMGEYENAMKAYAYLSIFDLHHPEPPFYTAKCLLALNRKEDAIKALRAAVFNSKDLPEHATLHSEASNLLEVVTANLESASTSNSNN